MSLTEDLYHNIKSELKNFTYEELQETFFYFNCDFTTSPPPNEKVKQLIEQIWTIDQFAYFVNSQATNSYFPKRLNPDYHQVFGIINFLCSKEFIDENSKTRQKLINLSKSVQSVKDVLKNELNRINAEEDRDNVSNYFDLLDLLTDLGLIQNDK